MALTTYETPIDWVPDPQYVNHPERDQQYLGWRLSMNTDIGTALWSFEATTDTPTVTIESLLPPDTSILEIEEDISSQGYVRHFSPKASMKTIETTIKANGKAHRDGHKPKKDKDEEAPTEEDATTGVTVDENNPPTPVPPIPVTPTPVTPAPDKPTKPVKP